MFIVTIEKGGTSSGGANRFRTVHAAPTNLTYGTPVKLAENADVKEVRMGVRNVKRSELLRLQEKTLDAQFLTTIEQGLNCSAFEANAVLDVVKEVYFSFLADSATSQPRPE